MARSTRPVILIKNIYTLWGRRQTDRRTWLDRLGLWSWSRIYILYGVGTLPSTCYILSDESSIPFYSTSNGNKNVAEQSSFWFVCFINTNSHTWSKMLPLNIIMPKFLHSWSLKKERKNRSLLRYIAGESTMK